VRSILQSGALAATFLSGISLATAADFKVLHAETIAARAGDLAVDADGHSRLSFQAYGRQFELSLRPNVRLLSQMPATQRSTWERFPIYRGVLTGKPSSWVRLTRVGDELHGAIWDGTELFTIEPARAVAPFALQSLDAAGADSVMYRLADTESVLDTQFCGVGPMQGLNASAKYEALVDELRQTFAAAAVATERIEIAFIADFEFSNRFPANTQGEMLARINVVDGIYSDQVGVAIVAPALQVFTANDDPFTTSAPPDLLNQLGSYRQSTSAIRSRGLAHLMTGRDLDGETAGIAFVNSLCEAFGGVGLSQNTSSVTVASLIAAHEIGHNFGAPHDAEADSACVGTPATFLMAPQINGSSTFSQCSLDQMRPNVQAAACITLLPTADAALGVPSGTVSAVNGVVFDLRIRVTSVGTATVNNVVVTATPGATLAIESAAVSIGTCSTSATAVTCTLGSLPATSAQQIDLRLRGTAVGASQVSVGLASANDQNAQNNSANIPVAVNAQSTSTGGGGGGGGGSLDWRVVLVLLSLLLLSRSRPAGPSHRPATPAARVLR
jgi:hypothetical protein